MYTEITGEYAEPHLWSMVPMISKIINSNMVQERAKVTEKRITTTIL